MAIPNYINDVPQEVYFQIKNRYITGVGVPTYIMRNTALKRAYMEQELNAARAQAQAKQQAGYIYDKDLGGWVSQNDKRYQLKQLKEIYPGTDIGTSISKFEEAGLADVEGFSQQVQEVIQKGLEAEQKVIAARGKTGREDIETGYSEAEAGLQQTIADVLAAETDILGEFDKLIAEFGVNEYLQTAFDSIQGHIKRTTEQVIAESREKQQPILGGLARAIKTAVPYIAEASGSLIREAKARQAELGTAKLTSKERLTGLAADLRTKLAQLPAERGGKLADLEALLAQLETGAVGRSTELSADALKSALSAKTTTRTTAATLRSQPTPYQVAATKVITTPSSSSITPTSAKALTQSDLAKALARQQASGSSLSMNSTTNNLIDLVRKLANKNTGWDFPE